MRFVNKILSIVILSSVASCSKDSVIQNKKEPEQNQNTMYIIQSISYDVKSALIEELLDKRPNLQYSNNTSIGQKL